MKFLEAASNFFEKIGDFVETARARAWEGKITYATEILEHKELFCAEEISWAEWMADEYKQSVNVGGSRKPGEYDKRAILDYRGYGGKTLIQPQHDKSS